LRFICRGWLGGSLIISRLISGNAPLVELFAVWVCLPLAFVYLRVARPQLGLRCGAIWGGMLGADFGGEAGAGVVGYIAGLPVLAIGFVITFFPDEIHGEFRHASDCETKPIDGATDCAATDSAGGLWLRR